MDSNVCCCLCFFFFNDTATTEIYTLSLHDALPIYRVHDHRVVEGRRDDLAGLRRGPHGGEIGLVGHRRDRKSTRLNSSHANISYAVFCLKKKKKQTQLNTLDRVCISQYKHTTLLSD